MDRGPLGWRRLGWRRLADGRLVIPGVSRACRLPAAALPVAARRLVQATAVVAVALAAAAVAVDATVPSILDVVVLAGAIAGGEAIRVDLPYRRGGTARFTLGDAALAAGLLLVPPTTVLTAAVLAITAWQLLEGQRLVKLAFNVAQYLAGAAAATLMVQQLAPRPGTVGPSVVGAAAIGIVLFGGVNTVTVAGIIAATSGDDFAVTVRRMIGTAALLAAGNACLGLLAVLLFASSPWALPALAVPLVLLHAAYRQEVRARVDRERSQAFIDVEHRLGNAADPDQVRIALTQGVGAILGSSAAVWRDGTWLGDVPPGSGSCPVEATLSLPLVAQARALGPAVDGEGVAVGLGDAVLVVWSGELDPRGQGREWLERLAASGRVHAQRSVAATFLRQERATLRAVVDGTGDGILVLDADGLVRLCNPAMAALAQVDGTGALHLPATEVLGDGPWATEGVHDVRRGDGDGERVWRVSVSTVRDRVHGELRVAAVHDVTTERRVARMKDDMLSIVSHELRTPLTPIKGSAQLLRRRWERMPAHRREELLAQIEQRSDHLTHLVEDLLLVGQLSSAGDGAVSVRLAPTDLAALAREATEQLAAVHPHHEIALDAPETLAVVTDALRLRQILDNLVGNACKFSPAGSRVDVRLADDGEEALLAVTDCGRGIPVEDRERIFERFERVEDPLLMTTSGAGLGLYIVRALARALGGSVTVVSTLGTGSTFSARFPATVEAVTPASAPARVA
jgi:signal transduction histidine kinase